MDYEARDASLRRKLFDIPFGASSSTTDNGLHDSLHDIDLQALSPPPKTPEIVSGTEMSSGEKVIFNDFFLFSGQTDNQSSHTKFWDSTWSAWTQQHLI